MSAYGSNLITFFACNELIGCKTMCNMFLAVVVIVALVCLPTSLETILPSGNQMNSLWGVHYRKMQGLFGFGVV